HLQRTFKRIKGVTPHQYAELCRLRAFKARLHDGASVTSALYDAGYTSSSSVYERAACQLRMTPTVYRQGGKGARIGYTVTSTLQYPLTDRRNEESLTSLPSPLDKGDSNGTIPNTSNGFALGYVLIAATERGVVTVRFGDSETELG